jgi:hypothetical protein
MRSQHIRCIMKIKYVFREVAYCQRRWREAPIKNQCRSYRKSLYNYPPRARQHRAQLWVQNQICSLCIMPHCLLSSVYQQLKRTQRICDHRLIPTSDSYAQLISLCHPACMASHRHSYNERAVHPQLDCGTSIPTLFAIQGDVCK